MKHGHRMVVTLALRDCTHDSYTMHETMPLCLIMYVTVCVYVGMCMAACLHTFIHLNISVYMYIHIHALLSVHAYIHVLLQAKVAAVSDSDAPLRLWEAL